MVVLFFWFSPPPGEPICWNWVETHQLVGITLLQPRCFVLSSQNDPVERLNELRENLSAGYSCPRRRTASRWIASGPSGDNGVSVRSVRKLFKHTVPGTLNSQIFMVVSIGWFQTFTWEVVVWPNIHLKLGVWGSRLRWIKLQNSCILMKTYIISSHQVKLIRCWWPSRSLPPGFFQGVW